MNRAWRIIFISAGLWGGILCSQASESAKQVFVPLKISGLSAIPGLSVDQTAEFLEANEFRYAILSGRFAAKDTSLAFNNQIVLPDKRGRFRVKVPITDGGSLILIHQVDFLGGVQSLDVKVTLSLPKKTPPKIIPVPAIPPVASPKPVPPKPAPPVIPAPIPIKVAPKLERPKDRFEISLGLSLLSLAEQGALQYSEKNLSLKFSYEHSYSPSSSSESTPHHGFFGLGISGDKTLLPFDETGSSLTLGLFDIETYGFYSFSQGASPWNIGVRGGLYYATTQVDGDAFGFHNFFGPELYPVLSYSISPDQEFFGTFKYAPVIDQIHGFDFSDTSIKMGLGYRSKKMIFSGDFQSLKITDSGPGDVQLNSLTFSVGLHF